MVSLLIFKKGRCDCQTPCAIASTIIIILYATNPLDNIWCMQVFSLPPDVNVSIASDSIEDFTICLTWEGQKSDLYYIPDEHLALE